MRLLLRGGRVVEPATGFDGIADILVDGAKAAITSSNLPREGVPEMDVSGLIVGPGFVDLHSHTHTVMGHRLQAFDGVTTVLDLEAGLMPVAQAYARAAAAGRPLNYGFSASWGAARAQVLLGWKPDAEIGTAFQAMGQARWQASSTPRERASWLALLERDIAGGALGIGILIGYTPGVEHAELLEAARLAAMANVPTYTHVRELIESDPCTPIDGTDEVLVAAAETGAAMHHCHVNATSRRHIDRVLESIQAARAAGSRITVESYPYGAGSTAIGASFLSLEHLARWGLGPEAITVVATGERIANVARLNELRAADASAVCIIEFLDESKSADRAMLDRALTFEDSIIASDAMPLITPAWCEDPLAWPPPAGTVTHPRTAGTFARTLRRMVREERSWSWLEAFKRCSYLPAQVIATVAPAARSKGRLDAGSDADIVILDPDRVTDQATYIDPARPSQGVRHLIVAGEFVIRDGNLKPDARPGRPIRGAPR